MLVGVLLVTRSHCITASFQYTILLLFVMKQLSLMALDNRQVISQKSIEVGIVPSGGDLGIPVMLIVHR